MLNYLLGVGAVAGLVLLFVHLVVIERRDQRRDHQQLTLDDLLIDKVQDDHDHHHS